MKGVGGSKKHRSFTIDGITFNTLDNAYFQTKGPDCYIGKIIKIWEDPKMVEVVWFFRPDEIREHLGNYRPLEKEIFLACGDVDCDGVSNLNKVGAIAGKCRVICTSKDARNPQPSNEDIESADFVFSRFFDVENRTLSETLPQTIAFRDIRLFLNHEENLIKRPFSPVSPLLSSPVSSPVPKPYSNTERKRPREEQEKNIKISDENGNSKGVVNNKRQLERDNNSASERDSKKRKDEERDVVKDKDKEIGKRGNNNSDNNNNNNNNNNNLASGSAQMQRVASNKSMNMKPPLPSNKKRDSNGDLKNEKKTEQLAKKPDRSKWFKPMSWEDQKGKADQDGTLVLFENFDPTYTSSELEDLILQATGLNCIARSIKNHSIGDPNYGEAYAIFPTKETATNVVCKLNNEFVYLPDGRPLLCSKGALNVPKRSNTFLGHLKLKIPMKEEMKKAVSTAHCSQANTIEFDLAMEWILNQEKYERAREELTQVQLEERKKWMQEK